MRGKLSILIYEYSIRKISIGCSLKFLLEVGIEEFFVNAPQVTDHASSFKSDP
jgi:hypothetical protein